MSSFASKNRTRLNVNELGARIVPAAVVTKLDLDGDGAADDVRIVGDAAADNVFITDDGDGSKATIKIDNNGDGDYTDAKDLDEVFTFTSDSWVVELDLKGGNDNVLYGMSPANDAGRTITAKLGAGADEFFFSSFGSPITGSSYISIDFAGLKGKDKVTVETGAIDNTAFSVKVDTGKGADTYDLLVGAADEFSTIDVRTDLGNGANKHTATFNGVGKFDETQANMMIAAGTGADDVTVSLLDDVGDNTNVSSLDIVADLGAGDDKFLANYDTGFKIDNGSRMSLIVRGGEGNDTLLANRKGAGPMDLDENSYLLIDLDGGLGDDAIQANFGMSNALAAWNMRAGSTVKFRLDGGYGNDEVIMLTSSTATSVGGEYDLIARGGAGDDTLAFASQSNGSTPTYGPAQGAILDGGAGLDTLQNFSPNVSIDMGVESV